MPKMKIAREEKSKTSMEQIAQLKANSEARNKMKETCKKKKEELCGSLNSNVKWKCWKEKKGEDCKNYF